MNKLLNFQLFDIIIFFLLFIGNLNIFLISDSDIFLKHLVFTIIFLILYLGLSNISIELTNNLIFQSFFYIFTFIFLIGLFIFGTKINSTYRWYNLFDFVSIQPTEFAKICLIFLNVYVFNYFFLQTYKKFIYSFLSSLIIIILIFKQPDLGNSIICFILIFTIVLSYFKVYFSLKSIKTYLILFSIISFSMCGFYLVYNYGLKDYQTQRIDCFFNKKKSNICKDNNFQIEQSLTTIGSGGIFGKGLGKGTQIKFKYLPEFKTDFIFASIVEQTGFIGGMVLIILFLILILDLIYQTFAIKDNYSKLILIAIITRFWIEIFINISMNINLIPTKGIPLPLISYGGSSLISWAICFGCVRSILSEENK